MVYDEHVKLKESFCTSDAPRVKLTVSDSIQLLNQEDWNTVLNDEDVFLTTDYLRALEAAMEETMEFRYVIFYCEQFTPIGIAYFQVADLVDTGSKYAGAVRNLGKGIGSRIISELKLRALVCGNVFHCGDHGFHFSDMLSDEQQLKLLESTLDRIKRDGDLESKVSIVLFKEFWPHQFPISEELTKMRFHMFRMDMNMMLDIRPHWKDLDIFLEDMTSKARTRVKSIMKRSNSLEFSDMDSTEIRENKETLSGLFKQVLDGSPFTFGVLEMEAYALWKEALGDDLVFQGIYHEGRMVGFMSAFINHDDIDVQYVGLDYEVNSELGIYQRILVEFLKIGMARGMKRIGYGRTAEQAKSSLGAVPVEMRLYTKHRNVIANKLITPVMNSVVPTEFELRSPFKVEA